MKDLKAFMIYPMPDPVSSGCLLVFHINPYRAKKMGREALFDDCNLNEIRYRRVKKFDQNKKHDTPHYIETNDDLPSGADRFYTDEDFEL